MFRSIQRMFIWGLRSFWRNGWLSAATVAMVALALVLAAGLILFSFAASRFIKIVESRVDLVVYIKQNVPESDARSLQTLLSSWPEVADVAFHTSQERLESFKARHAGNETTLSALAELDTNPFIPSITIRSNDPASYSLISRYLKEPRFENIIDNVNFNENAKVVERITRLTRLSRELGLSLALFLGFLAVVVAFSSIRLAIFSLRDEIAIMRFVGASNWFIRSPFVVQGIVFGILGTILSFLVIVPAIIIGNPYITQYIPELNLTAMLRSRLWVIIFSTLGLGIVVGVGSSLIAIRRYLKI